MPRVTISDDTVPSGAGVKFPQLKLATNETAMFNVLDADPATGKAAPYVEWVHTLRAIVIENGVGKKEPKQRRDKTWYEDWVYEFLGRPICIGDAAVLAEKGIDEGNCPACEIADKPEPRYAINIARYTMAGSQPQRPFAASVVIWSFTARMFAQLNELQNRLGPLPQHDLILYCEDGNWQRNTLSFSPNAFCRNDPQAFDYMRQLLAQPGIRATDEQLKAACGTVRTRQQIMDDCSVIKLRKRQADSAGSVPQFDPTGGAQPGGGQPANLLDGLNQVATQVRSATADPFAQPASQPASQPAPVPAGHEAAVAAQGQALFGTGQQSMAGLTEFMTPEQKAAAFGAQDPFGGSTAMPATTTGTGVQGAGSPSPTAPTAANGAPGPDPFASALPSAQGRPPASSTSAPSPASPVAQQPTPGGADPFAAPAPQNAAPPASTSAPSPASPPAQPSSGSADPFASPPAAAQPQAAASVSPLRDSTAGPAGTQGQGGSDPFAGAPGSPGSVPNGGQAAAASAPGASTQTVPPSDGQAPGPMHSFEDLMSGKF